MEPATGARRISLQFDTEIAAPPAVIFPLLCPVREHDWLPGWRAEMICSESGLAEDNCVFAAENPLFGPAIYYMSRHDAAQGIVQFVIFYPGKAIQKLDLALEPTPAGTRFSMRRTFTGLSAEGNAAIDRITEPDFRQQSAAFTRALTEYCRNH